MASNNNNKRQRKQSDTAQTSQPPSKAPTPTRIAETAISTYAESLREEVQPALTRKAKAFLTEFIAASNKAATYTRMEGDTSFIPRSARIQFEVKSNKTTSKLDEFQEIVEKTKTIVCDTQTKFRKMIMESLKIEVESRIGKISGLVIEGIHLCAKITLVEKEESEADSKTVTKIAFSNLEQSISSSSTIPLSTLRSVMQEKCPSQENESQDDDTVPTAVTDRVQEMATALFIIPLRKYNQAKDDRDLRDKLKKIVSDETEEATAETSMMVEKEPTVSPEQLADLIKQAVSKETKALRQKVTELEKKAQSHPKGRRGHRQGASKKEMNGKKETEEKRVRFKKGTASRDGADSDSPKRNGHRNRQRSQNSQHKKKGILRNGTSNKNGRKKQD